MSAINKYDNLSTLARKLRADLAGVDLIHLYAYNRTGKTRLSMAFKDEGKRNNNGISDTLYFNAFTEDLFTWDNDLQGDAVRQLQLNPDSTFFDGLKDLALDETIAAYLRRYADFDFDIDYTTWKISFSKKFFGKPLGPSLSESPRRTSKFLAASRIFLSGASSWPSVSACLMVTFPINRRNTSTSTTLSLHWTTTTL